MSWLFAVSVPIAIIFHGWMIASAIRSLAVKKDAGPGVFSPLPNRVRVDA